MATPLSEDLDQIEARITDCQSYNFGMRNADKLTHEDAPALLAEVRRLRKALAGHLFDGESLSTREAIRNEIVRELQAEAWDQGHKQGGPMHDVNYDDPDAHNRNPYRSEGVAQ